MKNWEVYNRLVGKNYYDQKIGEMTKKKHQIKIWNKLIQCKNCAKK